MDVKVLKLTPEFVQVDATAWGNFTRKLGFWYCPLNSNGIVPFLRHIDVRKTFLKTHGAAVLLLIGVWWVIRHVSPLWCPENYWVHVIVSLKQDASLLRMLSGFWRGNHTHGCAVTMLSPSPLNKIRTNSKHGERIFHRKLQVGALASSKKLLRKTKEIQNRKKTRPPLTVFYEI